MRSRFSFTSFSALIVLALMLAAVPAIASASTPAKVGPPLRVTALGDSITRAFDVNASGCTAFADCTAFSWATGSNATVNSYLRRVQALSPSTVASNGGTGNNAVTGAKVADLNGQAANAVATNPDMVLILIGANDVCTSSEAAMTSTADFRTRFHAAMETLRLGAPNARIMVMSIPNIWNLWNVLKGNFLAQLTWGAASICQSMLASPTSTSTADVQRRARVQQRNIDFNAILADECSKYIHCRYDGGAAYAITFASGDVSSLDYFHPNANGQAKAAATAWSAGPSYTDLTAPVTTITRDHPASGTNDWYKENVQITLSATDTAGVSGTEYFYRLEGAADAPWTKYTGPFTISTEGKTAIDARSVDVNGNIEASKSDLIKIDKTAPTFTLGCPSQVLEGNAASIDISDASDDRSGFVSDPNGSTSIPTDTAGHFSHDQEVQDQAGNKTSHSCEWDVYPTPGTPELSSGSTPNNSGAFGLSWSPTADTTVFTSLLYTLQHRDADDADWSDVDNTLGTAGYTFGSEGEGTWTYRVNAHAGSQATVFSDASDPVKVDLSNPAAPTVTADRVPDYAGDGGWYADSVTGSFSANGDPDLADGSSGSGVDSGSVPASVTKSTSGSHTISGAVFDLAGNESALGSLDVQVDATKPSLSVTCPTAVLLNATANATVTASDAHSGLATDPSGTPSIPTSTVGTKTTSATAVDNVGHTKGASCDTAVGYMFSGAQQPINPDGSSIFKLGSTVPVKFALTNAQMNKVATAVASLAVAKISDSVEGTFVEATSTSNATTGSLFRYDATAQQYIFNLATKGLTTGTYVLKIALDDGNTYKTNISLR